MKTKQPIAEILKKKFIASKRKRNVWQAEYGVIGCPDFGMSAILGAMNREGILSQARVWAGEL